jgi:hypothetical protein
VEMSRDVLLVSKAMISQIGCNWRSSQDQNLESGANYGLDSQRTHVCSSCLIVLGAVCARLVPKLPTSQKI